MDSGSAQVETDKAAAVPVKHNNEKKGKVKECRILPHLSVTESCMLVLLRLIIEEGRK